MIRQIRTTLANNLDRSADEREAAWRRQIKDMAEQYDLSEAEAAEVISKALSQPLRDLDEALIDLRRVVADVIRPNSEGSSHDDPQG